MCPSDLSYTNQKDWVNKSTLVSLWTLYAIFKLRTSMEKSPKQNLPPKPRQRSENLTTVSCWEANNLLTTCRGRCFTAVGMPLSLSLSVLTIKKRAFWIARWAHAHTDCVAQPEATSLSSTVETNLELELSPSSQSSCGLTLSLFYRGGVSWRKSERICPRIKVRGREKTSTLMTMNCTAGAVEARRRAEKTWHRPASYS